jgi:hypothetical protein
MEDKDEIEQLLKTQSLDIETLHRLKCRCLSLCEYELAAKIIFEERRLIHLSNISRLGKLGLKVKSNEIDSKK